MKYLLYMKQQTKCRALFQHMFNEAIIGSVSISCYLDYEFIDQIYSIGLNKVLEVSKDFNTVKWAVKSPSKVLKMFKKWRR